MSEHVLIAANATKAKLIDADLEIKLQVSDWLSYYVEGSEHTGRARNQGWDGRESFLEFSTGTFPAGFLSSVEDRLRSEGHRVTIRRKRRPAPLGPSVEDAYAAVNPFGIDPRYDYQMETVRRLEKHGSMIAQVATGGGKSMIARTVVKRFMRPTLFLTTRQVLMYQMKDGFEEAGFKVGVMGDGDWRPTKGVNVAMVQTLEARLKDARTEKRVRALLSMFEVCILEEAHEAGGSGYYNVLNSMPNALYRLALTATPFMRDDAEANMRLMAVSGQIGIRVPEQLLIERGILARPIFKYVDLPAPADLKSFQSWQKAYDLGIVQNENRNQDIVKNALFCHELGLPCLILIQRKAHGQILRDMLREKGLNVQFIHGSHDNAQRGRALENIKQGKTDVLIGSTILDVGVDCPAVGMVILAGGGKAEVSLRQRIGRGLRAKKSGPNVCLVVDYMDTGNKYLKKHARQRRGIVEATPGFAENILPNGREFNVAELGFSI
jgi:superfamily II DNA or RNA helicase